ncbi:PA2169 family four-helix-bundle protein [Emticicia sp. W12TSBA100-4]|uniref:ferritin-like domain-containing protein n=1 Tax=Emticicia sp. W12TSBA100-4 TaxID=3160965 RepID=UPI0033067174
MATQYEILNNSLNDLVEINYSRIDGYKTAAKDIDGGDLQEFFQKGVTQSENFVDELVEHISKFKGEPATSATFMGKIHQAWINFKATISSNNRETILNSCEFGDRTALEAYDIVLGLDKVKASPDFMNFLSKQRQTIANTLAGIKLLQVREAIA